MHNYNYDSFLSDLEEAIYWHQEWTSRVYKALIFGRFQDSDITNESADHLCKFGKWFHSISPPPGQNELVAIVEEHHEQMHEAAYVLLKDFREGGHQANRDLFDEFEEIHSLFFGSLYSLYKATLEASLKLQN